MALIICGHHRSGTTLMRKLCTLHPEMEVTQEMGAWLHTGAFFPTYIARTVLRLLNRAVTPTGIPKLDTPPGGKKTPRSHLVFLSRFFYHLLKRIPVRVRSVDLESAYRGVFPTARVVGDKYPDYIFHLDELSAIPSLKCLVLLREPKDVVASVLEQIRIGNWRGRWLGKLETAEKAAEHWCDAFDCLERNLERVFVVRYQSLVAAPERTLEKLGSWLGVDSKGFDCALVHSKSIGKHDRKLSSLQIQQIDKVLQSRNISARLEQLVP